MLISLFIASSLLPSSGLHFPVSQAARDGRAETGMPAIGGIDAPAGTRLLNFDLTAAPKAPTEFETYELASAMAPAAFKSRYADAARRAGYRIILRADGVSGVRAGGATFKLTVQGMAGGSSALLTVRRAGRNRA